ncbi:MAG TPA: ABC transporter ATP-binding protein [Bryobacteraceae bacterium]|nr:ABC transporter ATP-binding protein [Bryobacteraceae bacterium]
MIAVEFDRVSKSYPVYDSAGGRLKELAAFGRKRFHRDFEALREVSFSIRRGEVFCIIGANGSGKSTALQLIAGIMQPTAGEVRVQGRIAALLELGAGFNPEFTGRENVYLNGAILGLTKRDMDARYPQIEEFAEIGDFINRPVRTYSSGMVVRLAFAVAISVEPEILLVDEALAVGDTAFRRRCMRRIHQLKSQGVTIVFVTHSVSEAMAIGERVLWLSQGRVMALGDPDSVVPQYLAAMRGPEEVIATTSEVTVVRSLPNVDRRHGDGRAEVLGIAVLNEFGEPLHMLAPETRIIVRMSVRAKQAIRRPNAGFLLRNHLGLDFAGVDAEGENHSLPALAAGEVATIDFQMEIPELYPGSFSFSPWVQDSDVICDWIDNAVTIQMSKSESPVYGYVHWPTRVEFA